MFPVNLNKFSILSCLSDADPLARLADFSCQCQGFGLTEDGTKGQLMEGNVTIISDEECQNNLEEARK